MFLEFNQFFKNIQCSIGVELFTVTSDETTDSDFIVTHLINTCLKQRQTVYHVLFHQAVGYYRNACAKIMTNLDQYIAEMLYVPINVAPRLTDKLFVSQADEAATHLLKFIVESLQNKNQPGQNPLVICDGISALLFLGYSPSVLLKVVSSLFQEIAINFPASTIVFTTKSASEDTDEELFRFSTSLKYCSNAVVEICQLPTGSSQDVYGLLYLTARPVDEKDSERCLRVKMSERGAKLVVAS